MSITKTTEKTVKFTPINNPFNFTNKTKTVTATLNFTAATNTNVRESFFDKYPELPYDVEQKLVERMLHGDKEAQELLILHSYCHVLSAARQFRQFERFGVEIDELVCIGLAKLCNVVQKYDPTKGARFSTFVVTCVKNEIQNELPKYLHSLSIPRNNSVLISKIKQAQDAFVKENECDPDIEWLSDSTGLSEKRVIELLALNAHISVDDIDNRPEGCELSNERLRQILDHAFATISPRDCRILKMYFGFFGKDYTLQEIGKAEGLSIEGVRQVVKKALASFKNDSYIMEALCA